MKIISASLAIVALSSGLSACTAASQGNLEKVTVGKEEVFYSAQDLFQSFIRYNGSILYIAISPSRERAKNLILSTMS